MNQRQPHFFFLSLSGQRTVVELNMSGKTYKICNFVLFMSREAFKDIERERR